MLNDGDLVRIPQGALMMGQRDCSLYPPTIGFLSKPAMGIVLQTFVPDLGTLVKVLMDDKVVYFENKTLQLIGSGNVRKTN